jgi:hypothetical protein
MTSATQPTLRSRARIHPAAPSRVPGEETNRIEIVENPIHRHDAALGAAVEDVVRRVLRDESVGHVNVRFRVCCDETDGFRFICKVENPPSADTDVMIPWRWWSPLLESAEEFAASLEDGLRVRRARLTATPSL